MLDLAGKSETTCFSSNVHGFPKNLQFCRDDKLKLVFSEEELVDGGHVAMKEGFECVALLPF